MTTSTGNGEAIELQPLDESGAIDAFFAHLSQEDEDASKKKPSDDEGEEETSESNSDEKSEDGDEASDESPEDEADEDGEKEDDQASKKYAEDDVFFKVKVGEEEIEVSAKDLKRLYGQEAALTRKGQEVAEQRKAVEQEQQVYVARTQQMLQRATAKAEQFRQIPWMDLARDPNVPKEQLDTLQAMAQQAFQEEAYLQQESNALVQHINQTAQTSLAKQAAETVKVLSDPTSPAHIDGWNQQLYGDMLKFATDMGVPARIANQIVDAPTLKLLHMAMQFHKGAQKVTTVKTNKTPKKIVKTSSAPQTTTSTKASKVKTTMAKLARSGSEEDAVNAFMARLGGEDD
jgi:hypothetical protein